MSRERRATLFGWGASVALHAAMAAYIGWSTSTPDLGFEFALPDQVEFGLTEAVTVSQGARPPEATPSPPAAAGSEEGEGDGARDAGATVDAGSPRRDAGPPDAGSPPPRRDAGTGRGEDGPGSGDADGEGDGVAFLPAGSQLALRLDVTRIRESPFADDVRALLSTLPDWQNVLGGSGIDPLEDLDRLLIASPNLDRGRMILAGRSTTDDAPIRAAAAALAAASGAPIEWREEDGVEVTSWLDPSPYERVIAIVGPRHFVICRPEDLSRVLAVAHTRATRRSPAAAEHPADALLSMEDGEGLSIEIEGVRNFTRSRRPVEVLPTSARFAMRDAGTEGVAIRSQWMYEDTNGAREAREYWEPIREGYARNIIVRSLGLGTILGRTTLEQAEEEIHADVDITVAELTHLLQLGARVMEQRAARTTAESTRPSEEPESATPASAAPARRPQPSGRLEPPRPPPSPY